MFWTECVDVDVVMAVNDDADILARGPGGLFDAGMAGRGELRECREMGLESGEFSEGPRMVLVEMLLSFTERWLGERSRMMGLLPHGSF